MGIPADTARAVFFFFSFLALAIAFGSFRLRCAAACLLAPTFFFQWLCSQTSHNPSVQEAVHCHLDVKHGGSDPDADLPSFRVSDQEAAKIRARGEDPYIGQRMNYLQGTSVSFGPLLAALSPQQRDTFMTFEKVFPAQLDADTRLKTDKFYQKPDRFTLLIFLQADGFNVKLAAKRLVDTIVWRQQAGVDEWVDNPDWETYNVFQKYRTKRILGFDNSGYLLVAERLGEFFGSDNGERALSRESWLKCHAFELTLINNAFRTISVRENRAIHSVTYLGDLAGLRFRQCSRLLASGYLGYITKGVERFFPENVGKVFVFNAPSFVEFLLPVAKLILDQKTFAKMNVTSNLPRKKLRDEVGPHVLPQEWGGDLKYVCPHVPTLPPLYKPSRNIVNER